MSLVLLTLIGCRNLSCGEFAFEGEIPVTYIDNAKGPIPIGGQFAHRCTNPISKIGRQSTYYWEPELSLINAHELQFLIGVDHRNGAVQWNVAKDWYIEVSVAPDRVIEGETVSIEDGVLLSGAYWYTNGPSAGDAIEGTVDSLGFFSHYMPGGPAELTFTSIRAPGGACSGEDVQVKARWDLEWGAEGSTSSWGTGTGENWFEVDAGVACAFGIGL